MKSIAEDKQLRSALLGRLLPVLVVFFAWSLLISWRLVDLQAFRSHYFETQARKQQQGFIERGAKRGEILDRQLEELAITVRSHSIFAHPDQVDDPLQTAQQLAAALERPVDALLRDLSTEARFVYLKRRAPRTVSERVKTLNLKGIGLHEDSLRVYPNRELAAHVLGFVGTDNQGLSGLEYRYGEDLKGNSAKVDLRVDARRNSFHSNAPAQRQEGNALVLTIDRSIQYTAESVLRETVLSHGALSGSVIAMEPRTGQILAMASFPGFDPNHHGRYSGEAIRNRPILEMYEPGSTFKIVTFAALLNEGLVDPMEIIDCRAGTAQLAGKVYREAKRTFEDLTAVEVLSKSSNIGTVKLALRLGNEKLFDYVSRLGFGEKTGVDLPGEQSGILRPTSQWSRISIGAISIGQEIAVTPLQMVRAVAAIANGGYLVKPYVVRRVVSPRGDTIFEREPERRRVLSAETCATAREMLRAVVRQGTGTRAQLKGYSSAGKTGTAQKIVNGRYSPSKHVASFAGFAPVENPALVSLIVINEPQGIPYGGNVAAPAFKEIMERALIDLGIPQDEPSGVEPPAAAMASNESVGNQPENRDPKELVEREEMLANKLEETVLELLKQNPSGQGSGAITVSLDSRRLPDFSGMSLRQVARECARLGLRLKISGTGRALAQRPLQGQPVAQGMVCEVFFAGD